MKYYSEKLDKMFSSIEALEKAESVKKKKKSTDIPEEVVDDSATVENEKEGLLKIVKDAEKKFEDAKHDLKTAQEKVEVLSKAYLEEVDSIIKPAQDALREAENFMFLAKQEYAKACNKNRTRYFKQELTPEEFDNLLSHVISKFWMF